MKGENRLSTKLSEGDVLTAKELPGKTILVVKVWESFPQITLGNRMSCYENKIYYRELDKDWNYDEKEKVKEFTTCNVYCKSVFKLDESKIEVIGRMKKKFIKDKNSSRDEFVNELTCPVCGNAELFF